MSEKSNETPKKILLGIKRNSFLILLLIIFIIIFVTTFALAACSSQHDENSANKTEKKSEMTQTSESTTYEEDVEEAAAETTATNQEEAHLQENLENFSIRAGDYFIVLQDWDDKIDLNSLLGNPLNESIEILADSADTFSGSFIKTMQYDGLEIILFSPKDNGNSFWIMEIIVTGEGYSTYQGIEIGDSLKILKEKYPSLSLLEDGRTDENNCAYEIADREKYNYLRFEMSEGLITQIRIFHEIP